LEAAETIIFLNEIRGLRKDGSRGKPRWTPEFTDADFDTLLDRPFDPGYAPLCRMGCKMATGSGKTVVMAMLITWTFCNRGRVPSDERFPNAVLVCCPNLTIRERLQVLRTDTRTEDYYTQFDLVPPQYRDLLRTGKVIVTNWHFFAPESEHSEGGKSYPVVKKGEETDDAFARNRLGELFDRGPIMVLNDGGHHAYRPAPISEKEAKTTDAEAKKEREEATIWVQGLDRINKACGIKFCVDMSATPFYIKGSGFPEGEPFPWIVSDFGLVDAIESGITKIPRLPVSDNTGQPDPRYFRLWRNITKDLVREQRLSNGRPKPEVVWERAQDALVQLAGEYKKSYEAIQQASDTALKAPPVLIVVCDNTDIAQVFFENVSGQSEVEKITENEENEDDQPTARHPAVAVSGAELRGDRGPPGHDRRRCAPAAADGHPPDARRRPPARLRPEQVGLPHPDEVAEVLRLMGGGLGGSVRNMKALLQAGSIGRAPVPPEKRFFISGDRSPWRARRSTVMRDDRPGERTPMDLYIASARPAVIRKAIELGAVGVATNPSVVAEVGLPWREALKEAADAQDGPMLVQVVANNVQGILEEAAAFRAIVGDRLIVKVPMSPVAVAAMRRLQADGFEVMITTIVTLAQGLVAVQAGTDHLGIYVGRAERAGIDPYGLIRGLRLVIDRRGAKTKIGVGSINDVASLVRSALAGADNAAPTLEVLAEAIKHTVTEQALSRFESDWRRIPA